MNTQTIKALAEFFTGITVANANINWEMADGTGGKERARAFFSTREALGIYGMKTAEEAEAQVIKALENNPNMSILYRYIKSSQIEAAGWDRDSQTLGIVFAGGANWHYVGVPEAIFDALMESDSVGSFFAKNIKGKYPEKKVDAKS